MMFKDNMLWEWNSLISGSNVNSHYGKWSTGKLMLLKKSVLLSMLCAGKRQADEIAEV